MPNLQSWIEEQLKKGYSKKELKVVLSKKNYPKHVISEVDKAGNSNLSKKPFHKLFLIVIVLIAIVVIAVALLPKQTSEELTPSESTVSEVTPVDLCDEFKDSGYTISCEEASALALADKPGIVEYISVGTRKAPVFKDERLFQEDTQMWLFDIKLNEPFYDNIKDKTYTELKVGIGTEDSSFVYWEELE